jgi:outer membrane protein assembly factor BamB
MISNQQRRFVAGFTLALFAVCARPAAAADAKAGASDTRGWFQYRGPSRDGISVETGLAKTFGPAGPKTLWRIPIGAGFSAVSAVGDRLYTMHAEGGQEFAICLDAATGRKIWSTPVGAIFNNEYGDGPRSTPTVEGDAVYVHGSQGRLAALRLKDGSVIWQVELRQAFEGDLPTWAFTSAPLLIGDLLIIESGGKGARAVAAFDKKTGALKWTSHEDQIVYSSPLPIEFNGKQQIVVMTKREVIGLDLKGQRLWGFPFAPDGTIKPAPPVFVAPDLIFVSASYGIGAKVARLVAEGETITAQPVWEGVQMKNHFNGSVSIGNHLYGFDTATLKCIEATTGKTLWAKRGLGKGSLIVANGMLIIMGETGELVLAEATPEAYRELARTNVLEGRSWTQPTLWQGRLYLRNHTELVALDLRG